MKFTDFTKKALHYRRGVKKLRDEGFIQVSASGYPLWKFQRGDLMFRKITEARVGPDEQTVWIKVSGDPC